jgi:subtilase family serine protease
MNKTLLKSGIAAAALMLGSVTASFAAAPKPADLGALSSLGAGEETMSVTLSLGLNDLAGAEAMMVRLATPGDPLFHQFLTPAEIRASFGPNEAEVARAMSVLSLSGFTVERPTTTTLKITGSVSTMERVFNTELHQFSVADTETAPGFTFRAAAVKPTVPSSVASVVQNLIGFNNAPQLQSNMMAKPSTLGGIPVSDASGVASDGTPFGSLTVKDFANFYDVNPIYAQGINGEGRTLAVVTLAAFTPSDAQTYWDSLNLVTKPNRITIVNVDGGPGAPSDASGSDETTLDVEQSGGIAPQADIIVYQAPNSLQAFVDVFAKAVEDNVADSMSTSFGLSEIFSSEQLGTTVTDEFDGETVSLLQAFHEVFVLGALEGQSLFAAAGDSGAFDTVRGFGTTDFTFPLSVESPSSDTAMTAAGGTTLPFTLTTKLASGSSVSVTVPEERVWGWDYRQPICDAEGKPTAIDCGIFSVGTGGGISVFFDVPFFQIGLPGVQLSQPGQTFTELDTTPPTDFFDFPANFAGRNVPDLEFNADPETGYDIFYTSSVHGFEVLTFIGGTSFVAPQLNGVTALLGENAGHRFGLFTVPIYALARSGIATLGPNPALHTITTGDNWFFTARNGFSPAAGLGTIQVSNLAKLLK